MDGSFCLVFVVVGFFYLAASFSGDGYSVHGVGFLDRKVNREE